MNDWPDAIETLLELLDITQAELARRVGCTPNAVEKWLAGQRTPTGLYRRSLEDVMREAGVAPPGG